MEPRISYISPRLNEEALQHAIAYKLMFILGKDPSLANKHEWLNATLFAVRDRLVERWLRAHRARISQQARQVYYLSMEFLIGRTLSNALLSLGIYEDVKTALAGMGLDLEELIDEENDPGLGNGGLGRLAACFLDSLATLGLPGRGYGIRYDYGMFKQNIIDGRQMESPDYWLEYGNPWEFERHKTRYTVRFGGRIQHEGKNSRWLETEEIIAVAYDQIIPGYETDATNTLRLWSAQASSEINLGKFNQGDYFAAVEDKNHSENVSRVLYPDDSTYSGRELRLRQEYFLVSATVQDILFRHYQLYQTYDNLADKIAIHLNDTHPVLSIPELMRLLIDEHRFSWDDAFGVTCQVFSYTNHTLMSEALETWPVEMLGKILPRHLQIIFEINDYFLKTMQEHYPDDIALLSRTSIIDESNDRRVRMAWLAVVVSHKVNGVSELHSRLMVESLFADFARIFPRRFTNVTNGVTPRRWLAAANSCVLTERRGRPTKTGSSCACWRRKSPPSPVKTRRSTTTNWPPASARRAITGCRLRPLPHRKRCCRSCRRKWSGPVSWRVTAAPGNGASIGGLKVMTDNGWFAARPSGTEDAYKIYCESFLGEAHRKQIEKEAVEIVNSVLAAHQ